LIVKVERLKVNNRQTLLLLTTSNKKSEVYYRTDYSEIPHEGGDIVQVIRIREYLAEEREKERERGVFARIKTKSG
jgi:hypothetical protein